MTAQNNAPGRILLTGASGQLGSYVLRELRARDWPVVAWNMRPDVELFGCRCRSVDLRDTDQVINGFRDADPDYVIHTAALSSVADCFRDPAQARQVNATGTRLLADLADRRSARMVYVSTDLVFNGEKPWYAETDCPTPLSVYGQTKATAERAVLDHSRHLVVRISLLFGPAINGRPSFFEQQLQAVKNGAPCKLFRDEWRTPLSLQLAAQGLLDALRADVSGILHLGGPERLSRLEMGQRLAQFLGRDPDLMQSIVREDVPASEPRPRDTSLNSEHWCNLFPQFPRCDYDESLRMMRVGP